jgi:hypothetical protein
MSNRKQIKNGAIDKAIKGFISELNFRLEEKGFGTFSSRHEILGVIDEEILELNEAVRSKNLDAVRSEMLDIAVGCIFGVACIDSETLDW